MFKNMKVKKSLIVGFGTTILISAVIIIASLILMNVQKNAYTDILDHYVETNQLVSQCRIDYNIAARNLRDVALSGNQNGLSTVTSKLEELSTVMSDMKTAYPKELKDRTLLDDFVKALDSWKEEAEQIAEVVRTDRNRAAEMIVSECTPALDAAAKAGDRLASDLQNKQKDNSYLQRKSYQLIYPIPPTQSHILYTVAAIGFLFVCLGWRQQV